VSQEQERDSNGGYKRYHGDGSGDYRSQKQTCPLCRGKGVRLIPQLGRAGHTQEVPCSCTREGQKFWDKV